MGAEGDVQTFCSRAGLRGVGTPLNELVPMPLMALASFPLLRHLASWASGEAPFGVEVALGFPGFSGFSAFAVSRHLLNT